MELELEPFEPSWTCEEYMYDDHPWFVFGAMPDEFSDEWRESRSGLVDSLELSEEEDAKWLYSCVVEKHPDLCLPNYVVSTIKLKELLECSSSSSSSPFPEVKLKNVARETSGELSYDPGCGVFKSQIMFAGGVIEKRREQLTMGKQIYIFDTKSPENMEEFQSKLEAGDHDHALKDQMRRMDKSMYLARGRLCPLMVELGDKLYALSCCPNYSSKFMTVEVYQSDKKTWKPLPAAKYPFKGIRIRGNLSPFTCHAVVGTKLLWFVWFRVRGIYDDEPGTGSRVFLFDPESTGNPWKQLRAPSDSFGLSLEFQGKALVVNHRGINILFFFDVSSRRIAVYTMSSLDDVKENEEFVKLIGYFKLPFPNLSPTRRHILPDSGDFIHIGGTKVLFVGTQIILPYCSTFFAIPFQFDIDTTQEKKRFTLNFMQIRAFKFPCNYDVITNAGCFLL